MKPHPPRAPEASKYVLEVSLKFEPMKGFGGGFRQEWISGTNDDCEVGLDSGGGLGNPYLTFWYQPKNDNRQYFTADMRHVIRALGAQAAARVRSKKP